MSLKQWLALHPASKIMQPDPTYKESYDSTGRYDLGRGKSELTKTDSASWKEKSWVVGVQVDEATRAFDWLRLKKERVINQRVGNVPVAVVMGPDNQSFAAFERKDIYEKLTISHDTLFVNGSAYDLSGKALTGNGADLKRIRAYQEFWHSWRTFHPDTQKY